MRIRPSNGAVALTGGLALAVLLGPFLIHEDAAVAARLQINRQKIADMTAAERQSLQRNYDRWQSLTSGEQQQWRQFAQQLDAQRATFAPVLEDYYRWLETIPGHRRDDLRQARDVQAKVALVKEIAQEQLAERLDAPDESALNIGGRELPILSSAELDAVIAAIEEGLLPAERERLVDRSKEPLIGVERHIMVFSQLLGRYGGGLRQMMENPAQRERVQRAMPERLTEQLQDRPGTQRAMLASASLAMSLRMELEREFRTRKPSAQDLRTYYDQLPADEQEDLLEFSAEDFQTEMSRRYYRWQLEQRVDIDLSKVQRFLDQMGPQRGERPPDGRGPFPRTRLQLGSDGGRPFFDREGFRRPGGREGEDGPARPDRPPPGPPDGDRPPRPDDRPPPNGSPQ